MLVNFLFCYITKIDKLLFILHVQSLPDFYDQQAQLHHNKPINKDSSAAASMNVFSKFDVIETSYHLVCEQIDLHLCDDPGSE